jgi:hypothetical protein
MEDADHNENIPKLILSQFRWLDMISNNEKLSDKLLEIIEGVPEFFQKEIILFIPEIIDDSAQDVF